MDNSALAAAFDTFQQKLRESYNQLFAEVVREIPFTNRRTVSNVGAEFVGFHTELAAVLLLPHAYPSLKDKASWLLQTFLQAHGATQPGRGLSSHRKEQRTQIIDAAKQLTLQGESFRLVEVGKMSGIDISAHQHIFGGGFNELRELALKALIADMFLKFGIATAPDQG